jgi:transposase
VVGRGELTDKAWARIKPLLPAQSGRRGGRWRSHRQVIDAILWKERTGAPWRERLRKWTADGTWDRILEHVIVKDDSLGTLEDNVAFVVSVDSTSVRAHQHAAGARKKGSS